MIGRFSETLKSTILGLIALTATCACAADAGKTLDVHDFGALGDGRADDTAAIQKAFDAASPGDTVRLPQGTYLVRSVGLRAGVRYLGERATIKRPPLQPKFTRTFTMHMPGYGYSGDADSPQMIIEGFTFDGSRSEQGPYAKYELEQAHQIFLTADPSRPGRLKALVRDCHFREGVADGLSVYTNVDVEMVDCSSYNCFRGGFVLTGGHTRAVVRNFSSDGSDHSAGFDIEVDGKGYGGSLRTELTMEKLRLRDGHFDIAVSDGSQVTVRNAHSRSGLYLHGINSHIVIENSDLGVGRFSDAWNRIVFPGDILLRDCRLTLRPELEPQPGTPGKWAAVHLYWNISGTAHQGQKVRLERCEFLVSPEINAADQTTAVFVEKFSEADADNVLELHDCHISSDFDTPRFPPP